MKRRDEIIASALHAAGHGDAWIGPLPRRLKVRPLVRARRSKGLVYVDYDNLTPREDVNWGALAVKAVSELP